MDIGQIRHRAKFQKGVPKKNDRKETVREWEDMKTIWAAIMPEDGREFYRAKQETQELSGLLRIRYYPGLLETLKTHPVQVIFRKRVLRILWVRDVRELKEEMLVAYKEEQ